MNCSICGKRLTVLDRRKYVINLATGRGYHADCKAKSGSETPMVQGEVQGTRSPGVDTLCPPWRTPVRG